MSKDITAIAEAMSAATSSTVTADDITGTRTESSGDVLATTRFGHKARITTAGEVELLVGPGSVPDIYDAPELPVDEVLEDLPPLEALTEDLVDSDGGEVEVPDGGDVEDAEAETIDYEVFKVDELRGILEDRGLSTDGLKAELIARLVADDADE